MIFTLVRSAGSAALAAALLLLPPPLHAQRPARADLIAALDGLAAHQQFRTPYAGLTILVARGNDEPIVRAYGMANLEHGVPTRAETVYAIASITKQFTAAAILLLAEEGKLSLDDELTRFFPDFPAGGRRVTVHHLLTHTSGLAGTVPSQDRLPNHSRIDFSPERVIELRQRSGFRSDPGAVLRYSDFGYFLLGQIVEKASGQRFEDYLRERIFTPLGLTATTLCDPSAIVPHRAAGYEIADGRLVNAPFLSYTQAGGAWGLCSSALDLLRWQRALSAGRVISRPSLDRMLTPVTLSSGEATDYAYGVIVFDFLGHRRIHHTGGGIGFTTSIANYPDDSLVVAVLSNTEGVDARTVEQRAALLALGEQLPANQPLTPEQASSYIGTFEAGPVQAHISARPGGLQAEISGTNLMAHAFTIDLLHQGGGDFLLAADPATRLLFVMDGPTATKLILRRGSYTVELPAVER